MNYINNMDNLKTSLNILLFIYDGRGHKRTIEELNIYLIENNLKYDQLKELLYPLVYSNGIILSNNQVILKCYSENDLKEMLLFLYLFHNK